MKHTPGPWYTASTGNHQGLVISEATTANVAVAYDSKDADLIAAAPELLASLESVVEKLDAYTQDDHTGRPWLREVMAVIAKARGEA